jgi:hypothetical protein
MTLLNLENELEVTMGVMRRRAIGRSVVRTAATTAVVVGTAHAVNKAMTPSQQAAPQEAQAYEEAPQEVVYVQAPAAPAALPAAPSQEDVMAQLTQYSKMHDAGVLTDDEFAAVKAKLLGI